VLYGCTVDSFLVTTIIVALCIVGLNVFVFREKLKELLDFPELLSSAFRKSILFSFLVIVAIYVIGFIFGVFSDLIIFFMSLVGMTTAIYGMSLKKSWFMIFWVGVVVSALITAIFQIDRLFEVPIWSLIIIGIILINVFYYHEEKKALYL